MVFAHALRRLVARLIDDRRGVTAVEYGLIIALIVLAMMAGLSVMADTTIGIWGNVATKVSRAG